MTIILFCDYICKIQLVDLLSEHYAFRPTITIFSTDLRREHIAADGLSHAVDGAPSDPISTIAALVINGEETVSMVPKHKVQSHETTGYTPTFLNFGHELFSHVSQYVVYDGSEKMTKIDEKLRLITEDVHSGLWQVQENAHTPRPK
ncbi:unnamed protein product [Nezara viridula]|uniref:Uncharacterized protein n=1 Tax=Nezara viridula TaxID=85310 RepID=A0A9P0EFN7_NEZVI|nr:unnamed protein product [Nezara viridula]CAH1394260.1 unnamed protein product [Nezara viridula]